MIERTDSTNGLWQGISIDGYLCDKSNLINTYKKVYLPRPDRPHPEDTDILSKEEIFRKAAEDFRANYNQKVGCESLYCDFFLLKFKKDIRTPSILEPLYQELMYDKDKNNYRHILVFSKGCGIMNECTRGLIEKLSFKVKQAENYMDHKKFMNGCEQLMDVAFKVYVVPCIVIQEHLENEGLTTTIL